MDFKRLGTFLIIGGVAVVAAAFAWWMTFYSSILRNWHGRRARRRAATACSTCSAASTAAGTCAGSSLALRAMVGRTPYEPMVLWLGLAGLVAGAAIRFAAKPAGGRA